MWTYKAKKGKKAMILLKIKYQGISVGYLELQTYHPPDESLGLLWRYSKDMKEWTGFKNEWPHFDQALLYITDDKNGEPVFEGDKIKGIHITSKEEIHGEVVWDNKACQWGIHLDGWIMGFECLFDCFNCEIIGNIHTKEQK